MRRRLLCLLVATTAASVATASCAEPRTAQTPPPWFTQRVQQAEAANRDYPTLADVRTWSPPSTSYEAWRQGVGTMAQVRAALLADPNLADVDDAAPAEAFTERSRAEAIREMERQALDE